MNLIDFNNKNIRILTYFLLIIGSAFILLPFLWLISTSFKDPVHVYQMPPDWIPDEPNLNNFQRVFGEFNFLRYLWNSLWLSIVNIIGNLISCSMTAYAFASSRFKYKKQLFIVLLATMMIPGEVVFFPQFILFNFLGWYGSMKPLFVPSFLGNAFFIFLLRQYFLTIPKELVDAARIDGCSEWQIFGKIYLPLSKPALATVAIYTFMSVWNDFLLH
jgi:ABC-type glycerol-3-phosphate transport system permease component